MRSVDAKPGLSIMMLDIFERRQEEDPIINTEQFLILLGDPLEQLQGL